MRIGAHVSSSGSIDKAVDRVMEIGAEAVQMFASGPTNWHIKDHPQKDRDAYKAKAKEHGIGPTFFHGVYLINLGSPNPELRAKGVQSLIGYQQVAATLDGAGTIFHVGSHKGHGFETIVPQVVKHLTEVLEAAPPGPSLIIENSAGMGNSIGASFAEIGTLIKALGSDRVKVCLDTQHSFANGYNVATKVGLNAAMDEFDREIGLKKLVAVHANDSKCPLLGGLDRHANIGEGHIGLAGFENIMRHPAFKDVPFLLEVPGFDNNGPDKKNVDILKSMRDR
ncbi:MAG: deoxyribonuclease IV [Chloroflexi bacterium]|nr:deoxyribonuclease IV [Chloroflexota bacterium]